MAVNLDKPARWKADVALSVDMYNDWFMYFAPDAFRSTRILATKDVEEALRSTDNMTRISSSIICEHPDILPTLRISTFEEKRNKLQTRLDAMKTQADRNRLGQFATPTALALDILAYASTLMPEGENIRQYAMERPSGILDIEMRLQKFQRPQLRGWLDDAHARQVQIQLGQGAKAAFSGAGSSTLRAN